MFNIKLKTRYQTRLQPPKFENITPIRTRNYKLNSLNDVTPQMLTT